MLLDIVHELPLIGEGPVVVPAELFQHQTSGFADAEWLLEDFDQRLGRQRWWDRFQGQVCQARLVKGSPGPPSVATVAVVLV